MSKAAASQTSFSHGELSPLMAGRVDTAEYAQGLHTCVGFIPLVQGGITAAPGTYHVNAVKDSAAKTMLMRFEFSTIQAYAIEFGNLYCRFYRDDARIESPPGTPIEIVTPYTTAQLFELQFTQSADNLYVTHPAHKPRKITRTSHTVWTISVITFLDGPYLNINTTLTTVAPSATTGAGITLTASAATFVSTDVGRFVRIRHVVSAVETWGYAVVTVFTSTTLVTADVVSNFSAAVASTFWRLGVWSDTTGYPRAIAFYEDRLFLGGATNFPQRLDGSKSGDYENMAPTATTGIVAADNAISVTFGSRDVNVIQWLLDDQKALVAGTPGGPWLVRPSNAGEALSPANVTGKRLKSYGCARTQAIHLGGSVAYIQKDGRKLRSIDYGTNTIDGFDTPDLTLASEHITRGGIGQMAVQLSPQPILWTVRGDGALIGMTFSPGAAGKVSVGWHRHTRGGAFSTGAAVVDSVIVIPATDGTRDQVWMIVKRTINGVTVRNVEYMKKIFDDGDSITDAFFVDSGLTYSGVATSVITNLGHLEGQTVSILGDGAAHPQRVVVGAQITLDREVVKAHVGLDFLAQGSTLRFNIGAQNGTSQGKLQRIYKMAFRLHSTGVLQAGRSLTALDDIIFRTSDDLTNTAVPPYTGDKAIDWDDGYSTEARVFWKRDKPLPCTILAIFPQLSTEDGL